MADVDADFQAMMEAVRCCSDRIAEYLKGHPTHPRIWCMPPLGSGGWDGDPLDISGIKDAFDRDQINTDAENDYNDTAKGKAGITAGYVLQIVYIGMMERAYRSRHSTVTRALLHTAGRRKGHGDQDGIHTGDIINYIQDILDTGGTTTAAPPAPPAPPTPPPGPPLPP
jgi:hypothetical protein